MACKTFIHRFDSDRRLQLTLCDQGFISAADTFVFRFAKSIQILHQVKALSALH
jgi:hypothetical protein